MPTPHVKPTQVMLGLPAERLAQLRAIANHHGVTTVEIIERTIRRAIENEEIGDDLPGLCKLNPVWHDLLEVTIRDRALPPLDRLQVDAFALLLCAAAGREELPDREWKSGSAICLMLDDGHKLYVGKNASAVLLGLVDGKTGQTVFRTSTTLSLATDLAALLRKHARKMSPSVTMKIADGSVAPTELLNRIISKEGHMPRTETNEAKQ